MSTVERDSFAAAPDLGEFLTQASHRPVGPVRVHGKFFFAGDDKYFVKGVTYGPFAVGSHGSQVPERDVVVRDEPRHALRMDRDALVELQAARAVRELDHAGVLVLGVGLVDHPALA